jgi:hypothetical protein
MSRDDRMVGFASQHIDDPTCFIPLLVLIGEKRTCCRLDDPTAGRVFLQRPLKGPHEQVALGPVIEDHAKPGIRVPVFVGEGLFRRRNIGLLAAQDIEPARRDLGLALKFLGVPQALI